jgi:hypothetical protein
MFDEETASAYSNALDFFGIEEPTDFDYHDDDSGIMFEKVEETMKDTIYIRMLFTAVYKVDTFEEEYDGNNGFTFAMSELADYVEADSEYDDFGEFCDSIIDA